MSILLIEDDIALGEALCDVLESKGHDVYWARNGTQGIDGLTSQPSLVLSDINLGPGPNGFEVLARARVQCPLTPVILMTAYSDVAGAVRAIQAGAADYLAKPFKPQVLLDLLQRQLTHAGHSVVAHDPASVAVLDLAKRIAASNASVLITGESGTGKEVLARYIHDHSERRDQNFVAINCAAIPENMLEASLFGYEKGAFTGALKSLPGKFEQACGGTLLLDEVTEMHVDLQAKLLRVLQEREVERLGSTQCRKVDVRVLATTKRDPMQAIAQGTLRQDLYYRLNVMPLAWLPLAQRPMDILPLAQALLSKHARQSGVACPRISPQTQALLQHYDWPGNIRELENCMHRALVLCNAGRIEPEHTLLEIAQPTDCAAPGLKGTMANTEFAALQTAIQQAGGRKEQAAKALGISPRTLRHKLAKFREEGLCLD